jgi:hypothetical protein
VRIPEASSGKARRQSSSSSEKESQSKAPAKKKRKPVPVAEFFDEDVHEEPEFLDDDDFGDAWDDDSYEASSRRLPPKRLKKPRDKKPRKKRFREVSPEYSGGVVIDSSILGGLAMMIGAAVWFFVGLSQGVIFFYPPVMFVLGGIAVIRGIFG